MNGHRIGFRVFTSSIFPDLDGYERRFIPQMITFGLCEADFIGMMFKTNSSKVLL